MQNEPLNEAVQSTRGFNVIFIHSSLDDAGLTPQQFRVFAHLSRRASDAVCWASLDTMAKTCRMHADTVKECLKWLETRQMISKETRQGKTTLWKVKPSSG